ncbi:hypothetical protein AB6A40_010474 [Gnathostoma spinigerum]|uniref:Trehalase n=1 Tax=Gnathostoma spinigerum TaxID=75299 RepID=A0ABD6EUX1_9BILA
MHETAKHIIQNIGYLVEKYGYMLNGGRVYYMRRTQPPFFIPMVYEYHTATEDDEFLLSMLGAMEKVLAGHSS